MRFGETVAAVRDNAYEAHLAPGEDLISTLLDASGRLWHGASEQR